MQKKRGVNNKPMINCLNYKILLVSTMDRGISPILGKLVEKHLLFLIN
jgi:hypothetical protein